MEDKTFSLLEKMYIEMQQGFTKANDRLDHIENRILKLEVKIDGEVNTKQESLLDGYNQNSEALNRIDVKLDKLESKIDKQEVEIKVIKGGI